MNKFCQRLKELRTNNNLSLIKLGLIAGVSDMTVLRWENGKSDIKGNELLKLAIYFHVSTDYLLGLED